MSNEFETKILEKLDRMEFKIDKIGIEVDKHTIMIAENRKAIEGNRKAIEENRKAIETNTKMINENRKMIGKNSLEIAGLTEVITAHHNTLIKFEHDFNEKFKSLFDSFSANKDEHHVYDNHISNLNSKIFNHDIRLSSLEDFSKKVINS